MSEVDAYIILQAMLLYIVQSGFTSLMYGRQHLSLISR